MKVIRKSRLKSVTLLRWIMSLNILRILPMIAASAGLFAAGSAPKKIDQKKNDLRDCNYLCVPQSLEECDAPWDLSASATYQQVRVQAGDIGLLTSDRSINIYPVNATGIQPFDDFAWGFQVGAGFTDYKTNWRIGVDYNYFKAINNRPLAASYGFAIAPSIYVNNQIDYTQFTSLLFTNLESGNYTLLNNVEIKVSRPSMLTPNLEFTTLFGFDVQFLQRRQIAVFSNSTTDSNGPNPTGYVAASGGFLQNYQKYTWWGVGPLIGFHSNWHLGSNFYFFFDGSGSVTYGLSTTRGATFARRVLAANGPSIFYQNSEAAIQNAQYQYSPCMKYLLGFSWNRVMDTSEARLTLRIAYSSEYFFYLMRTIQNEGAFRAENGAGFGIQGLILNVGIDF
jgi:hypothetical protein